VQLIPSERYIRSLGYSNDHSILWKKKSNRQPEDEKKIQKGPEATGKTKALLSEGTSWTQGGPKTFDFRSPQDRETKERGGRMNSQEEIRNAVNAALETKPGKKKSVARQPWQEKGAGYTIPSCEHEEQCHAGTPSGSRCWVCDIAYFEWRAEEKECGFGPAKSGPILTWANNERESSIFSSTLESLRNNRDVPRKMNDKMRAFLARNNDAGDEEKVPEWCVADLDIERCWSSEEIKTSSDWQCAIASHTAVRARISCLASMKKKGAEEIKETMILDAVEKTLCDSLFGVFASSIKAAEGRVSGFDKGRFDEEMESYFGSLDKEATRSFQYPGLRPDLTQAQIFSLYLARKCWSPTPSTKFSLTPFYERVLGESPPVNTTVAQQLFAFSRRLFWGSRSERKTLQQPNFPSGCIEYSRLAGGKRAAYLGDEPDPVRLKKYKGADVVPIATLTGGKIRVVTLDRLKNQRWSWLNTALGKAVRRHRWCIFGREVSAWREEAELGSVGVVSGDLEAATDNIASWAVHAVLDAVAVEYGLRESDVQEIRSFTTTGRVWIDANTSRRQSRGQLMGSILSFPILCAISAFCCVVAQGDLDVILRGRPKDGFKKLRSLNTFGVNGDDSVVAGARSVADRWIASVESVGGVVSRGKSLYDAEYFTVNSELWHIACGKVLVVRPSLLCALSSQDVIATPANFDECIGSGLLDNESYEMFDLDFRLGTSFPRSWGGLGLIKREMTDEQIKTQWGRHPDRFQTERVGSEEWKEWQEEVDSSWRVDGPAIECVVKRAWLKRWDAFRCEFAFWDRPKRHPDTGLKMTRRERPVESLRAKFDLDWRRQDAGLTRARVPIMLIDGDNSIPEDFEEYGRVKWQHLQWVQTRDQLVDDPWSGLEE
jgi:hypothetical protein